MWEELVFIPTARECGLCEAHLSQCRGYRIVNNRMEQLSSDELKKGEFGPFDDLIQHCERENTDFNNLDDNDKFLLMLSFGYEHICDDCKNILLYRSNRQEELEQFDIDTVLSDECLESIKGILNE